MFQREVIVLALVIAGGWLVAASPKGVDIQVRAAEIHISKEEAHKLGKCLQKHDLLKQFDVKSGEQVDIEKINTILEECLEKSDKLRPLVVVFNVYDYFVNSREDDSKLCGVEVENSTDKRVIAINQELNSTITDTKTNICSLILNKVAPALCSMKKLCKVNATEVDDMFALFYASQQLFRNHPDPFSCKDQQGKELLGQIINPLAYKAGYDFSKNQILIKPVPCNANWKPSQSGNQGSQSSQSSGNQGSQSGNQGSQSGNQGSQSGNQGSQSGNQGSQSGNQGSQSSQSSGNQGSQPGNQGSQSGNQGSQSSQSSGNQGSQSGNQGSQSGNQGSQSGNQGPQDSENTSSPFNSIPRSSDNNGHQHSNDDENSKSNSRNTQGNHFMHVAKPMVESVAKVLRF